MLVEQVDSADMFEQLLVDPKGSSSVVVRTKIDGALVGRLVGFKDDVPTPLVVYDGQPQSAALSARATLDLQAAHIGREVVLMFEDADPYRPVIVGCVHDAHTRALPALPRQVEVDADGERIVVSAKQQLVFRCGEASITLTSSGKVLIQGEYVSSRSLGLTRIRGGAIQLN
jgi:hypothetical protein